MTVLAAEMQPKAEAGSGGSKRSCPLAGAAWESPGGAAMQTALEGGGERAGKERRAA